MLKSEIILWRILAIAGLNFFNYKLGPVSKNLRLFFLVSFLLSLSYCFVDLLCKMQNMSYKEAIGNFLVPVYSGLLWWCAYSRKKTISNVMLEVYCFHKGDTVSNKKNLCIITFLLVIIPTLYCVVLIFNQIMMDFEAIELSILGFKVQNKIWKRILEFYLIFSDLFFFSGFILYFTMCMCVLFRRCSEILTKCKKFLRIYLQKEIKNDHKDIFSKYFYIVKILRKINESFSHLTFLIIVYYLKAIFIVLLSISLGQIQNPYPCTIVIFLYHSVRNIAAVVFLTVYGSMIPERLVEIRTVVRDFLNCKVGNKLISEENLFYLYRIENQDVVHISA